MQKLALAALAALALVFSTGLNGCPQPDDSGRYQVEFFPAGATREQDTRVFVIDTKTGRKVEVSFAKFVETSDLSTLFPAP